MKIKQPTQNDRTQKIRTNVRDFRNVIKGIANEKGIPLEEASQFAAPYYQEAIGHKFDQ